MAWISSGVKGRRVMGVKDLLVRALEEAIKKAMEEGELKTDLKPEVELQSPRERKHGDLSTNVVMKLSKGSGSSPSLVAKVILKHLMVDEKVVERVEVAPQGFINFYLSKYLLYGILRSIQEEGPEFGRVDLGKERKVLIEFVSANPTGPLTVAHGRHATFGDVLANVLEMAGYKVKREYYYNDTGTQMNLLGSSVKARYLQLLGEKAELPEEGYRGEYITEIAKLILDKSGRGCRGEDIDFFRRFAEERIFEGIKEDLKDFGVRFDGWVKEGGFHESGAVKRIIEELRERGDVYERDGALWLRSSRFGDEKDRVVKRATGEPTYLAPDIAYHQNKFKRGFDELINLFGPDHHGYIPRLKAAIKSLDYPTENLKAIILQLVSLYRGKKRISMSTRAGEFITLRQILDEVGADAARFFFLMRRADSHLDFDLELAKKEAAENPVYYIQYAHARICSIFKFAVERGIKEKEEVDLSLLKEVEELELIKLLSRFPDVVEGCARSLEPHHLTTYLQELASSFHNFYDKFRVIGNDEEMDSARLVLVKGVRTVLQNGLKLLGISAPEKM